MTDRPAFRVVWRGYDRRQVDAAVGMGVLPEAKPAPSTAAPEGSLDAALDAMFTATPVLEFDVVLRGYDRHEVDEYFREHGR